MVTYDGRHLTISALEDLWGSALPIEIPLHGMPPCRFRLDPAHSSIQLITDYEHPEPDLSKLKNISFSTSVSDGEDLAELTVRVEGSIHGAYGLLATVADELQVAGAPLAAAVATAVNRHRSILISRVALTTEKEIGLYGELLLLEFLIGAAGAAGALGSWQGPFSEEHDYTLEQMHYEVKTTSTERRKHRVHGLMQLLPLRDIPLSVVSIQLTRTSGSEGRTLPQLIQDARGLAGGHVVEIDQRLAMLGWEADNADLYRTVWMLRSKPRSYLVRGDFPAMTPTQLERVIPNFGLVSEVSYIIDLTDRIPDRVPSPISAFVEVLGEETR